MGAEDQLAPGVVDDARLFPQRTRPKRRDRREEIGDKRRRQFPCFRWDRLFSLILEFPYFAEWPRSVALESDGWRLVGQASLPIACPEEPAGDEWDDARASSPVPPRISHGILLPEKPASLEA